MWMSVHVVDGSYHEVLSSHDGSPAAARGAVVEVLKFIGEPNIPKVLIPAHYITLSPPQP